MVNRFVRSMSVLIFLLFISPITLLHSRAETVPAVSLRSVGLFDTDGTVLYSILFASKAEALSKITITSTLPKDATFVEAVAAPPEAIAKAEANTITWQVASISTDTILGPFTYRVKFADKVIDAPANVAVKVAWGQPATGTAEVKPDALRIKPLSETATLVLDERGTLDEKGLNSVIMLGDTGIQFYAPAGAVSQKTTLTFTRVPVDAKSTPADVVDYWWCASVKITSIPTVEFSKPISLSLPTRRTLTPGMPAKFFTLGTDGKWQILGNEPHSAIPAAKIDMRQGIPTLVSTISPNGNGIMVIAVSHIAISNTGLTLTGGVNAGDRKNSTIAGAALPTAQVKDGTSNTIIASRYIEQDNIIAILIGVHQ